MRGQNPAPGRSTTLADSDNSKKFISWVLPGVLLVLANFRLFIMRLIALDFPTFERPAKATSVPLSSGMCDCLVAPSKNVGLHKSGGIDVFELFILEL